MACLPNNSAFAYLTHQRFALSVYTWAFPCSVQFYITIYLVPYILSRFSPHQGVMSGSHICKENSQDSETFSRIFSCPRNKYWSSKHRALWLKWVLLCPLPSLSVSGRVQLYQTKARVCTQDMWKWSPSQGKRCWAQERLHSLSSSLKVSLFGAHNYFEVSTVTSTPGDFEGSELC